MASNAGFGLVKEFLPDLARKVANKHKQPQGPTPYSSSGEVDKSAAHK
jgi:hypothetical protein